MSVQTLVERYLAAWNETDPGRREALVAETFATDATYLDPVMAGEGIDGIDTMIAGAQRQFPSHRFTLTSGPDSHHDCVRFNWSLAADGGDPVAVGIDFATLSEDGRLQSVTGFLEQVA